MDVNAESSLLQPANRDGGIDQDWAGDDQDWWDWYVTLPIRISARPRGHAGCTLDSAAHVKRPSPRFRDHAEQDREQRPVRPVQFRAARLLPLKQSELMAQDQDLRDPPRLLTP